MATAWGDRQWADAPAAVRAIRCTKQIVVGEGALKRVYRCLKAEHTHFDQHRFGNNP